MSVLAHDWPKDPYKGLVWYGPEDRLLFSGRDRAVETCIHFLAASETRILLLHGQTGCGKSSFLRAGLIPGLEENAFGYLFLRDAKGAPVFIRSGADPLARIAEQVFRFASEPVALPGVAERYDLSAAHLGKGDLGAFIEECRKPGMMMRALRALSSSIPFTLVIILDQAEEVISFSDSNHDHRRQFFRFIREFGTSNFPVKFILALRKDYSGEFIGLAQLGGAIDLRTNVTDTSPPSPRGAPGDYIVKSDIKIYLLPELRREEVQHAIELPTSTEQVHEDRVPPFERYRFTYAPGVVKRIVDDLFAATSATAVLPVMQIVCRDLYNGAKRAKKDPPWQIDGDLYAKGGGVSGPVDRHITESLKASFGKLPAGVDATAEEQRWRELLYRLVRREADGTVHTNIVDEAQFKTIATEVGVKAALDDVTAYLTRSDVLLLRSVSVLAGSQGRESRLFSLGHDAIGLVLQEWKVRALAAQRMADEEKAMVARIRKRTLAGVATVACAALVAFSLVVASAKGRAEQKHDVLMRIASANGRTAPMGAMYAAAHATVVADDMRLYQVWKGRDKKADELLAHIIAGMPAKTTFAAAAPQAAQADSGAIGIPLPKSVGFANVDGSRVEMVTGIGTGNASRARYGVEAPSDNGTTAWSAGEPAPGVVLLLESSIPSAAPGQTSDARVYVLTNDRQGQTVVPLSVDYFRNKATTPALRPTASTQRKKGPGAPDEFVSMDLGGGVLVLSKVKAGRASSKGEMHVASFVFDPTRPRHDPFKVGMEREFRIDLDALDPSGFNEPLVLDGHMVVPVALDSAQSGAAPDMWAVRYDLTTGSRRPVKGFAAAMECRADKCDWELIRRDASDNLVVFGKAKPSSGRGGTRSFQQASEPDVEHYDRFIVFDALKDESVVVSAEKLRDVRRTCGSRVGQPDPAASRKGMSRMFVTGEKDRLLFGMQTDRAVDLVEVRNEGGRSVTTCIGVLLDAGDVGAWRIARGGNTLLASGSNVGLSWNVDVKTQSRAEALLKQGGLVATACDQGLRGHESPDDELTATTTTYLGVQAVKLCDGPPGAIAARMERPAAAFPGVEVTTKDDLPSALKKSD